MSHAYYRIETLHPGDKWVTLMTWWGMPKGKAEGAWMVLRAFSGNGTKYRLVKSTGYPLDHNGPGEVIETHTACGVKLN